MSDNFSIAHKFTATWEGGESDHPADGGGLTKYGASLAFLKGVAAESQSNRDTLERMGIRLPITRQVIIDLTETQASSLFRWQFWDRLKLDLIPLRPAVVLYDAAVNSGPAQSIKLAQRGYNRCVTYGQPLVVDGIMGPATRAAMKMADTDKALSAMLDEREKFFQTIGDKNPSQQVFLRGWINRVDALRRYVRGL
ncbi:glycosyl hydrolase 108 family protein [Desulfovibrio intestinalis]|uniref:Lysozyme family protein n=1 Tax=Desulfovibrio intestinalis TaxID=58621 RepID=A0A7W8C453_9BACT|nr:lysozyme family protein [Desulfovibrio intestinalis]